VREEKGANFEKPRPSGPRGKDSGSVDQSRAVNDSTQARPGPSLILSPPSLVLSHLPAIWALPASRVASCGSGQTRWL
jgi:hypothetical protein